MLGRRARGVPPDGRLFPNEPVNLLVVSGLGVAKGDPGPRVGDPVARDEGEVTRRGLGGTRGFCALLELRSFAVTFTYFDARDPSVILLDSPGVLTVGTGFGLADGVCADEIRLIEAEGVARPAAGVMRPVENEAEGVRDIE